MFKMRELGDAGVVKVKYVAFRRSSRTGVTGNTLGGVYSQRRFTQVVPTPQSNENAMLKEMFAQRAVGTRLMGACGRGRAPKRGVQPQGSATPHAHEDVALGLHGTLVASAHGARANQRGVRTTTHMHCLEDKLLERCGRQ